MLWNNTQESWSDFLHRAMAQWRNHAGMSKEAAADAVVEIHNSVGGPAKTGQHFNPSSVTEQNRLKANCMTLDRAMEKDLFNMLPYVLAAMSPETKLAFAAQYLQPAGLTVHLASEEEQDGFGIETACEMQMELGSTFNSVFIAAREQTPQNLDEADRAIAKAIQKFKRTRALISGCRSGFKKAKDAVARAIHRKETV